MAAIPHVAILIETSRAYGRGLLRGVARYVQEHGPWSVFFRPQGLDAPPPPWLLRWRGDGILARINSRQMARAVLRTHLPAVDLRSALAGLGLPGIGPCNRTVAQLAFDHFRACGIVYFAFCGTSAGENRYLDARCEYFCRLVTQSGRECRVFEPPRRSRRAMGWEQEQNHLARWLVGLPKPVGVMTCHDDRGQQVLDACLRVGLAVPDEVAVVGVDNDEHLCGLSNPPLSSIDVNPEGIGYDAASLLDKLMQGARRPKRTIESAPRGVVVRQSSDVIGVTDPQVAAAIRLIRQEACRGLSIKAVARRLDVSQSALERRFLRLLGRSPKQEVLRVQLASAKELLSSTAMPLAAVARRAGFSSSAYFCELFHRRIGMTPGDYRRQFGGFSRPEQPSRGDPGSGNS